MLLFWKFGQMGAPPKKIEFGMLGASKGLERLEPSIQRVDVSVETKI